MLFDDHVDYVDVDHVDVNCILQVKADKMVESSKQVATMLKVHVVSERKELLPMHPREQRR